MFDGPYPGLGMYSQYFVHGKKAGIDEEGENGFDDGTLFIKWSQSSLLDNLELLREAVGIYLSGVKYVNIRKTYHTHHAKKSFHEDGRFSYWDYDSSCFISLDHSKSDYNKVGFQVQLRASNADGTVNHWLINC